MNVDIFDISENGEGIGRIDGKVVFVKNALPGDCVNIEITKDKGSYCQGRIVGENKPVCGGAPLIRYPYDKQLAWKEKRVRDCLTRIAKLDDPKINPIVGMEYPYNYRNKGEFKVNAGLPFCNVDCTDCPIQSEKALEILKEFRENPVKNAEELVVRTSRDGEVLSYTIQASGYPLLFKGQNLINDHIGNLKIEVDAASFYQVNSVQCEKLYGLVKQYVEEGSFMLDLYCGAGTIGLFCSDKCSKVIGVESVREAIIQANRNAVINGNVNTTFICGKAEEVVPQKLQGVKADVVVLDPPRAGCKKSLLETVAQIGPEKLIYVSCDPSTLARDIKILTELGFEFIEATPVDMFAHTVHVETVALLGRKDFLPKKNTSETGSWQAL